MSRILMVTSEASPFAKTGGLGDVLGSLPAALAKRGEEVAVVLPRYRVAETREAVRIWHEMPLQIGPHRFVAAIDEIRREGVRYLFVDCPPLYDRFGIYNENNRDYLDNHIRFALLNRAAIEIARNIFPTDVFHAHDWTAGLLAPYLRTVFAGDPTFFGAKCVLTIHNLGYQGNFHARLDEMGLDPGLYHSEGFEFYGRISFLKAGIVWSDAITTVSPTYAREIQTPEYGFSFDGLLRSRAYKLTGILNGIDYLEWDPSTDRHLPAHYSREDLAGKALCKAALLQEMGLPPEMDRPLIGIVSRFVYQKGLELVGEIAQPLLLEQNAALVVLGSGEARLEDMFRYFAYARPDRFSVRIGYDNSLAHRIEAGADMFLMPSRYEPSGLNQMYSLRYGTVPIVRATGGLADSVDDQAGFKFYEFSPWALAGAVGAALSAFQDRPGWIARMHHGMADDFSWDASASKYQQLYRGL